MENSTVIHVIPCSRCGGVSLAMVRGNAIVDAAVCACSKRRSIINIVSLAGLYIAFVYGLSVWGA